MGISCLFVSGEARFVSVEAEATMGRGKGMALRGGLPTGAWAGLAARWRSRPPPMPVFVFRAERLSRMECEVQLLFLGLFNSILYVSNPQISTNLHKYFMICGNM